MSNECWGNSGLTVRSAAFRSFVYPDLWSCHCIEWTSGQWVLYTYMCIVYRHLLCLMQSHVAKNTKLQLHSNITTESMFKTLICTFSTEQLKCVCMGLWCLSVFNEFSPFSELITNLQTVLCHQILYGHVSWRCWLSADNLVSWHTSNLRCTRDYR